MATSKKTFKILSIDGGGIKGLYSLYVLKSIEDHYCRDGETLSDYFDMVCGTSTGAIIALGIANKIKTDKIIELYENNADSIFPGHNHNRFIKCISGAFYSFKQLCGYKYNNKVLINEMSKIFGNKTLKESNNLLCIPSFNMTTGMNIVFKKPYKTNMVRDGDILVKDAALASAAPPTFLPVYYFSSKGITGEFVDGGIWANNPSLVGIMEASNDFIGEGKLYDDFKILSIGNINNNSGEKVKNKSSFWNLFNFGKLIDVIFNSNSQATTRFCQILCNRNQMFRHECTNFPAKNIADIDLDNTNKHFLDQMKAKGQEDGNLLVGRRHLDNYFNDKKSFLDIIPYFRS